MSDDSSLRATLNAHAEETTDDAAERAMHQIRRLENALRQIVGEDPGEAERIAAAALRLSEREIAALREKFAATKRSST